MLISIGLYNLKLKTTTTTTTTTTTIATRLVQLDNRRFAEREATGSYPCRANPQGLKKKLRRKCCLCQDFCKRLDFLVFSDRDDIHLSKCCFVAGIRCIVYGSNMIMSKCCQRTKLHTPHLINLNICK